METHDTEKQYKLLVVANVAKEHINKFHLPTIRMFREAGWQVDVACRKDAEIPGCSTVYDLPCSRNPFRGGLIKSIRMVRQLLRENTYDAVHCHTLTGTIVARLAARPFRRKGLKVLYTAHGFRFQKGGSLIPWLTAYPMEKVLSYFTDVLITINNEDFSFAKKHLSPPAVIRKISGIGVSLKKFSHISETDNLTRASLGLSDTDFVLIYVAELSANKNQIQLLEMMEHLRPYLPQVKLLLVGPDHTNGRLQKLTTQKGLSDIVQFLGWRNDVPALLALADVVTASSKTEGLPINLMEAMAAGIPVIAMDNRGHRELVIDRVTGRLLPRSDVKGMADAVLELAAQPDMAKKYTDAAKAHIRTYDEQNVLQELRSVYRELFPNSI